MGTILFCAESASLADPASLGLAGGDWGRYGWLETCSDAIAARARLGHGDPIEEAWVASSDQMGAVNLAAALRRDAPSIPIYLVADGLSGSAVSRAQAAGVTGLLSAEGLSRRIAHEQRRRLGAAARAAALRAVATSAEPLVPVAGAFPAISAPRPVAGEDVLSWDGESAEEQAVPAPPAPVPSAASRPLEAPPVVPSAPAVPSPQGIASAASVPASAVAAPAPSPAPVAPSSPAAVGGAMSPSSCSEGVISAGPAPSAKPPVTPAASPRASGSPACVLSVVSGSGGAGKSAVAVLVACLAARRGLRVLLIDGDLQFGDAAALMGRPEAPTVEEATADPLLLDALLEGDGPALLAAPRRLEQAEALTAQLPRLLEEASARFDVVVVNTGSSWSETHAVIIERSARTLFLVDQRASSVRACRHALELCSRCGIATGSFSFLLNRCAKGAPLTSLDVSCALQGAPVQELRDGGAVVEELLGSGLAASLLAERNDLCASLEAAVEGLLPGTEGGSSLRGRRGRRGVAVSSAPDLPERRRGRAGRKAGLWGRRSKPSVTVEAGADR